MDLELNPKDLVRLCRICLRPNEGYSGARTEMFDIFDLTIKSLNIPLYDLFESFTTLQLDTIIDGFPKQICSTCRVALETSYQFQLKCIKSDHDIRMALGCPPRKSAIENNLEIKSETAAIFLDEHDFDDTFINTNIKNESDCSDSNHEYDETLEPIATDEHSKIDEDKSNVQFYDSSGNDNTIDVKPVRKKYRKSKEKQLHVCKLCNKSFEKPFSLFRHSVVHETEGRPFECAICKRRFRLQNQLTRHENIAHSIKKEIINLPKKERIKKPKDFDDDTDSDEDTTRPTIDDEPYKKTYTCHVCNKLFDDRSNFLRHSKIHPDGKPYECEICKEGFATENLLILHKITHFEDLNKTDEFKIYQCAECPRAFQKHISLISHMKVHQNKNENGKTCEYCKRTFSSLSNLARHMKIHDKIRIYICKFCNNTYNVREEFLEHINIHKGDKPNVCYICNKSYQTPASLKSHIRTHTGETPYLCNECGKSFSSSSNLRNHMITHMKIRKFQCAECSLRFQTKSTLKSHLLTHSGIKSFKCDSCDAAFYRNPSLTTHKQRVHSGKRLRHCKVCDMGFELFTQVKQHMLEAHQDETPYNCEFCDRKFKYKGLLVRHTRKHIGTNTYRCKECPAAFRLVIELKRHRKMHAGQQKDLGLNETQSLQMDYEQK